MKSSNAERLCDYLEVVEAVYIDATTKCSADVFDLRDLTTIRSRVKHEGLSFLTITLPRFAKDLERGLALGYIDSSLFRGFNKLPHGGAIPEIFQGMLSQLFDRKTGRMIRYEHTSLNSESSALASDDSSTVVEAIRQVCRTFAKVELACTPERVQAALDSFYQIELDLQAFSVPDETRDEFCQVSRMLWDNMWGSFKLPMVAPRHGPGATAERISGNGKFCWRSWYDRLEPYFPLVSNGYPLGIPEDAEELNSVSIVPMDDEQPVRVVVVPKTLKSPRVIAIEPVCMQYAQQAIREYLYDTLESSNSVTWRRVNFRSQAINQRLALIASKTGLYATIDLSEASDRVPLSLAMEMFSACPDLRDAILACRSTSAILPDGRLIDPLLKFASMGSALCFPVEAMFFYTCCVVAMLKDTGLSWTFRNVRKVARRVRIFGDDIIVPKMHADAVLDYLQKNNCKVNADKTFVSGSFRESCGVDAYNGYVVTPTYVRRKRPENRQQSAELISWCSTANSFYSKGYWRTASLMRKTLEQVLGSLPYVLESAGMLGHHSFLGYETIGRWNRSLHRYEVYGWTPRAVYRSDMLSGWAALTKCFLLMESRGPLSDPIGSLIGLERLLMVRVDDSGFLLEPGDERANHLMRTAMHGASTLKRRWAPAH